MALVRTLSFVIFGLDVGRSEHISLAYIWDNNFLADAEVGIFFAPPPVETTIEALKSSPTTTSEAQNELKSVHSRAY